MDGFREMTYTLAHVSVPSGRPALVNRIKMRGRMRIELLFWPLLALSLVTLLALVGAPACAPLCTAHSFLHGYIGRYYFWDCHGGGAPNKASGESTLSFLGESWFARNCPA